MSVERECVRRLGTERRPWQIPRETRLLRLRRRRLGEVVGSALAANPFPPSILPSYSLSLSSSLALSLPTRDSPRREGRGEEKRRNERRRLTNFCQIHADIVVAFPTSLSRLSISARFRVSVYWFFTYTHVTAIVN